MNKLILFLTLALPAFSQYRIPVLREQGSKLLWLLPGSNIQITATGVDCIVPPASEPPLTFVFFPAIGQKIFTVTDAGTVRKVEAHKNGVLLTDQGTTPDYSLSIDKKTVTLVDLLATASASDVVQVKVWH